jgi:hypothetical protein
MFFLPFAEKSSLKFALDRKHRVSWLLEASGKRGSYLAAFSS